MNAIRDKLAKRGNRKLLVPFLTAGYPTANKTIDLAKAAIDTGADFLELGMPFSDPMADGPEIQFSSQVALKNKINLNAVLKLVDRVRKFSSIPLILMGYYNPLHSYQLKKFLSNAKDAGVDGFIIPDLPPDEASEFCEHSKSLDLSTIFLVAPTSTEKRVKLINNKSSDFVYAVTVTGVTGSATNFGVETDRYFKRLKKKLTKPFLAGFGVSTGESAQRLTKNADGVVVGSALIKAVREAKSHKQGVNSMARILRNIRAAID